MFADLAYQVRGGENVLRRLEHFAQACSNDPIPQSIANPDEEETTDGE